MVRRSPARCFALALALLGLVAGCGADPAGDDDQGGADAGPGDDGGLPDAGPGASGLVLHWVATPQPPASGSAGGLAPTVTLTEVEINLFLVRAIGDSAPGDERTSVPELLLKWEDEELPDDVHFDQAPPGMYSNLKFRVGGPGTHCYTIKGTALHGNRSLRFEIYDDDMKSVDLPMSLTLEAGATEVIQVELDVAKALEEIDWEAAEVKGSPPDQWLELKSDDRKEVTEALAEAFSLRP